MPSQKLHTGAFATPICVAQACFDDTHIQGSERKWPQGFTPGYWVGWDDAAVSDVLHGTNYALPGDHAWTEAEVKKDCQEVIEQLLNAYKLSN
jgi:hypothetical protein